MYFYYSSDANQVAYFLKQNEDLVCRFAETYQDTIFFYAELETTGW